MSGVAPPDGAALCRSCCGFAYDGRQSALEDVRGVWHHPACPMLRSQDAGAIEPSGRPSRLLENVETGAGIGAGFVLAVELSRAVLELLRGDGDE